MSNLLDKASIILTPTAYNNGEALCVKPSDGSGDFDFSRNSAATRVNAQGLVENVQILSSNLVQNGDFSEEGVQEVSNGSFSQQGSELITNGDFSSDTAWVKGTGTTISGGSANFVNADGVSLYQSIGTQSGFVKITFNVTDYTSGTLNVYSGGNQSVGSINVSANALGTYTAYVDRNGGNVNIIFGSSDNFTGSIDNVSVREVGQDWNLTDGCSIVEQGLRIVSDGTIQDAIQSNVVTNGKTYKVQYEIIEAVSGSLKITGTFGANLAINSTVGVHTFYATATDPNLNLRRNTSPTDITITNISVKEVGQNWDLGTGWSIGNGVAIGTSATGVLYTNITITSSNKARIKADVDISGGGIQLRVGGVSLGYFYDNIDYVFTSNGNGLVEFVGQSFNGSITNISVIEITTDTSLPRINYEGFSYQDALGSEEVVNGGFDSDTAWTLSNSTISNGELNILTASINNTAIQSISNLVVGSDYKIEYKINSISSGGLVAYEASHTRPAYQTSTGVYSNIFTATATTQTIYIRTSGATTASIDNVSVKEYLGQEVVPDSGCGSWLWEPQSTNLITQSELFSDSYWSKINSSVTSGFSSPSGGLNAFKLVENTSLGNHVVRKSGLTTASTTTTSIFAKAEQRNKILLFNGVAGYGFNLSNGTTFATSTGIPDAFNITELNNGWYKCSITHSSANRCSVYLINDADSFSYTGDGTSGVYIFGAQVELGTGTSYIPTSGSTVTRNQDLCTNGGSLASINSTEGVLYFEGASLTDSGSNRSISISDGTNTNQIVLRFSNTANQITAYITDGGSITASLNNTLSNSLNYNKIALKYKLNDVALWVNGVEVATDTNATMPSGFDVLKFSRADGANNFFAKTKAVAVWKEALSDSELQSLTTI